MTMDKAKKLSETWRLKNKSKTFLKGNLQISKKYDLQSTIQYESIPKQSIFNYPLLPAKRTVFRWSLLSPLQYTVQVEVMQTHALDRYTVISRYFAARTWRLERKLANSTALLVFDIPLPGRNSVPGVDRYLHYYYNSKTKNHSFVLRELYELIVLRLIC